MRIYSAERRVQERSLVEVETEFGKIRVKVSSNGAYAPEYDDCRAAAIRTGAPLPQVIAAAQLAYLTINRTK